MRHITDALGYLLLWVSIHAPARGATRCRGGRLIYFTSFNPRTRAGCDGRSNTWPHGLARFQSTHPRGVRPKPDSASQWRGAFQSTHPRGVRPAMVGFVILALLVSIHAPARGATQKHSRRGPRGSRFNPRTRAGCDTIIIPDLSDVPCFNPRTRAGCDRVRQLRQGDKESFNPRTRAGCDRCFHNDKDNAE